MAVPLLSDRIGTKKIWNLAEDTSDKRTLDGRCNCFWNGELYVLPDDVAEARQDNKYGIAAKT